MSNTIIGYKNLEVDGVDKKDFPDFCDAYFSYAEHEDGTPLNDAALEYLTNNYGDVVNALAHNSLY